MREAVYICSGCDFVKKGFTDISVYLCLLLAALLYGEAEARTYLSGMAELNYVKYDAKQSGADPLTGQDVEKKFSGNSLAQTYSVTWSASNYLYATQPKYYDVSLGYDWLTYNTKTSDGTENSTFKDTFGKFRYNGKFGLNPADLPINFSAYAYDAHTLSFSRNLGGQAIMDSFLTTEIAGKFVSEGYGFTFNFEPERARKDSFRGLPRLYLVYNDTSNRSIVSTYNVDNRTKELAVAGLNQGNNWINYKSTSYEDNLNSQNNYVNQEFQIGHIDQMGRRLWSPLVNWIEVSADGKFSNKRTPAGDTDSYDVNFMAIADRRAWTVRTFMNYNRITSMTALENSQTENTKVPIYIKGIYGRDTNWFLTLSAENGKQTLYNAARNETTYSNRVALGATTFTQSKFTLSPSAAVAITKGFGGFDSLTLDGALETNSTARFSNKLGLAARLSLHYLDDGTNSLTSKSWVNILKLKANYNPDTKLAYSFTEELTSGNETPAVAILNYPGNENYFKSSTSASATWTPNAEFTTSMDATYDIRLNENRSGTNYTHLAWRASYVREKIKYLLDASLDQKSDGYVGFNQVIKGFAEAEYRPDRYNDGSIRLNYTRTETDVGLISQIDVLEKYSYNFFTRKGVIRNLATISQEFSYLGTESESRKQYSYYSTISGRYSPTSRLSLSGYVKYVNGNGGKSTVYYNVGVNNDFKLLTSSLDYTYAKREADNRIEKRLNATVRRTF